MGRFGPQLDWITKKLGDRRVVELERLATALWVTKEASPDASVQARAEKVNELKPHVTISAAIEAVEEIDRLIAEAQTLGRADLPESPTDGAQHAA
jgi:phage I-like protein